MGVDRVISVDLQRPGHPSEGPSFNVPIESCITDSLGTGRAVGTGTEVDSPLLFSFS